MKILKNIGKWLLFIIGAVIGIILIVLLIIRLNSSGKQEAFVDENGNTIPASVAINEDKTINDAPQRLTIRGIDVKNPVLLRVHGGPGSPSPPAIRQLYQNDLEDIFTVCYWEQRGAGLAYKGNIPDSTITLNQIVDDGIDIVNYLREKFKKDKIYIEGTSWGTTVSAFMVQKEPELFHAYIGIGQMANQPISEQLSYDFVMREAEKQNDTISINMLKSIGRPPYPNKSNEEMAYACNIERDIVEKYAPHNWFKGVSQFQFFKGIMLNNGMTFKEKFSPTYGDPELSEHAFKILWPTCFNINLMRDVPDWEIPVYIMQGDNDHYTETSLAKQYFDSIQAPNKRWYLFENATHSIHAEYPGKYRSIYIDEILKKQKQ